MECKDLFEPGDRLAFSVQVHKGDGNGAFVGAIQPDQLIINDNRIAAVSDDGRFMRVYSLENGRPLHGANAPADGGDILDNAVGLQTKSPDWQVVLSSIGPRIYAIGVRSLVQYNLNQLADTWYAGSGDFENCIVRDAMLGKSYLLLMDERTFNDRPHSPGEHPTSMVLCAYSRALSSRGRESGLFAARFFLVDPTGIQSWQGMDGGVYYLTGDQKLFFLKGAGK